MKKLFTALLLLFAVGLSHAATLAAGGVQTFDLAPGKKLTITTAAASTAIVQRYNGPTLIESVSMAAGATRDFGEYFMRQQFRVSALTGSLTYTEAQSTDPVGAVAQITSGTMSSVAIMNGSLEITETYAGTGSSHQPVWVDLTLDAAAGSNDGTDPAFLAPMMGNIMGADVVGDGNYLAGLIGAYSITGTNSTDYPKAALLGIIMDGSTDADAIVLAHIDGSDPSSATRAGAAFGVSVANNHASSSVDYGLDLYAAANPHYSGTGVPFSVAKAAVRMPDETCVLTGAGVPVDYTDGDPAATGEGFAGPGSLYIDITNAKLYINGGTKAQPIWKIVTSAS